jgi:hypothetical protein
VRVRVRVRARVEVRVRVRVRVRVSEHLGDARWQRTRRHLTSAWAWCGAGVG